MLASGRTRLDISALGRFRVSVDGFDLPATAWPRRSAPAVLKILSLAHEHRVHREQMMEYLWPEADPTRASNNLHQSMHAARRALESVLPGAGSWLVLHDRIVQFAPDVEVVVDALVFEQAASAAIGEGGDIAMLQQAAGLYTGALLPDDLYEPWAIEPRQRLSRLQMTVLEHLARHLEESGDDEAALETLYRIVAIDQLHEPAFRALMRILARTGQFPQAVRTFELLGEVLERELGLEPAAETKALYREVLSGQQGVPVLPRRRDNLPAPVNTFVGRRQEIEQVRLLLGQTRLLTLTGSGGCGKSRLSVETASGIVNDYADGVWLVELAALADPALIPQAIAAAVGIREQPGTSILDTLKSWSRTRNVLLLFDNCEHLIEACAMLAANLLSAAPGLTILATSREPLRIDGETTWTVPSLALPDLDERPDVELLLGYEAVDLFVDRASQAQPGFRLTPDITHAVAELCYRLDGIPLAIELAASRTRALSVEQIVERLEDRFALLTGGNRAAFSRQQTLRATLDWSLNLLDEREQVLFGRLSVFAGGFDLAAVEDVCSAPPLERADILELLTRLVDRSLVVALNPGGAQRYTMLETMREYARDVLVKHGDVNEIRTAHVRHFSALARHGAAQLQSANQHGWLEVLEREHDNLRLALDWSEEQATAANREDALLFAASLYWFWRRNSHFSEGCSRIVRMLEIGVPSRSAGRAAALSGAGALIMAAGEYDRSRDFLNESIALWRELENSAGLMQALIWSGWVELFNGEAILAKSRRSEGLSIATELDDQWFIALALLGLGFDAVESDEYQMANAHLGAALDRYRAMGDDWGTATALQQLAKLTYRQGDFVAARQRSREMLAMEHMNAEPWRRLQALVSEIARAEGDFALAAREAAITLALADEIGNVATRAWTLRDIGFIRLATGELDAATEALQESLEYFAGRDYPLGMVCCLAGFAGVALERGDVERAARLLGTVNASLDALGMALAPADRLAVDDFDARSREILGEAVFKSFWETGASNLLDEVVACITLNN